MTADSVTHGASRRAVCLAAVLSASLAPAQDLPAPETAAAKGAYQVAWLTLEKAWEGKDASLFVGLRDGKGTAAWFCGKPPGAQLLWYDEITLVRTGDALKGKLSGRMANHWPPAAVGDYSAAIDARVTGETMTGRYSATFAGKAAEGKAVGTIVGEEGLAKRDGFPAGKDWPWYYGADGVLVGPECGRAMVDVLNEVRPLWKAEEPLPGMWGNGPEDRYAHRACFGGCSGGASSPVVASGRVYCYYFRPSGAIGAGPTPGAVGWPKITSEKDIIEHTAKWTRNPLGVKGMVDWFRPFADDIVVCLDAVTGKTVWRTTCPQRGRNIQCHKWRGYNPTPCVAAGKVFAMNYQGRIWALDAASGKFLWEHAGEGPTCGPAYLDGVVLAGSAALDAATGKELWRGPGVKVRGLSVSVGEVGGNRCFVVYQPTVLSYQGVGADRPMGILNAVEPRTGKVICSGETKLATGGYDYLPLVAGDLVLGARPTSTRDRDLVCARLKPTVVEDIWTVKGPVNTLGDYSLTVIDGHAYYGCLGEILCVDLKAGKVTGSVKGDLTHNTAIYFHADGRLFTHPEGRHGGQRFWMLDPDPRGPKILGKSWSPPHPHDTAYANHPVVYPVVDGRVFIRGHDGLYCYDLRKGQE